MLLFVAVSAEWPVIGAPNVPPCPSPKKIKYFTAFPYKSASSVYAQLFWCVNLFTERASQANILTERLTLRN
jgi:hypothetical protein